MNLINNNRRIEGVSRSVVSIGNFDGVHKGHCTLIETVKNRSRMLNAKSLIITFVPHTKEVLGEQKNQQILTTCSEKEILIRPFGIDILVCFPFNSHIASLSAEIFVEEFLLKRYKTVEWVMGENHVFGSDRKGARNFLHKSSSKKHFNVFSVSLSSRHDSVISSTRIRSLILKGAVDEAVEMLGHAYLIIVQRIRGKQNAGKMGIPTINFKLPPSQKVVPPAGVYAACLDSKENTWKGACYIGNCPTFGDREYHIEFHAFGATQGYPDINQQALLWLHSFVRAEDSFKNTRVLEKSIYKDIEKIRIFFAKE